MTATESRISELCKILQGLTDGQIDQIELIARQFKLPFLEISSAPNSDFVIPRFLQDFGDTLRIHHCFSREPFTKDKFEYAFVRIANKCGISAQLATRGNPGHDMTLNDVKVSLKTQADRNIKEHKLHISKFMELGKGRWVDSLEDLVGLRDQFFSHMLSYDRIISLRCLGKNPDPWHYEIVEIPKPLLMEAESGSLRIMDSSKQMPKPGYCDVNDSAGKLKFQLYFDGGTVSDSSTALLTEVIFPEFWCE